MSTAKLTWSESLTASAAGAPFKPFDVGRVIRNTFVNIGICVVLYMAARELDGWLAIAMWVLLGLRFFPYLFTGMLQKVVDERRARLELLTPMQREAITSTKRMAREFTIVDPTRSTRTTRTVGR